MNYIVILLNLYLTIFLLCGKRDGDKMAPSVEKKIAELEMGLLHLQQNIDIPEITLTIHPTVAQAIKTCTQEGRKPRVGDFGDKVDDSNFLNALQGGVNRWIREIQKVSMLHGFFFKNHAMSYCNQIIIQPLMMKLLFYTFGQIFN